MYLVQGATETHTRVGMITARCPVRGQEQDATIASDNTNVRKIVINVQDSFRLGQQSMVEQMSCVPIHVVPIPTPLKFRWLQWLVEVL